MIFEKHSDLIGKHAFLGASQYHWLNDDSDKLINRYNSALAKERGTRLHDFAATAIQLGEKLPRSKKTLNMYVNDAIGFKMTPEQPLFYSYNCFGTADAICFRNNLLRIHDLKTGMTPAHMEQLMIYAALFCLEYKIKPTNIEFELRIYQFDEINTYIPDPLEISDIMNRIVDANKTLLKIQHEGD